AAADQADGAGGAACRGDVRDRAQPGLPGPGVHRPAAADRPAAGDPAVPGPAGERPTGREQQVFRPHLHRPAGPSPAARLLPHREVLRDHRQQPGAGRDLEAESHPDVVVLEAVGIGPEGEPDPGQGMDPSTEAVVSAQLARPPRGLRRVAHSCPCGRPDVVETAPRLPDGTPFPTLYYLTCPRAAAAISRLEAAGLMETMTARLGRGDDPRGGISGRRQR